MCGGEEAASYALWVEWRSTEEIPAGQKLQGGTFPRLFVANRFEASPRLVLCGAELPPVVRLGGTSLSCCLQQLLQLLPCTGTQRRWSWVWAPDPSRRGVVSWRRRSLISCCSHLGWCDTAPTKISPHLCLHLLVSRKGFPRPFSPVVCNKRRSFAPGLRLLKATGSACVVAAARNAAGFTEQFWLVSFQESCWY